MTAPELPPSSNPEHVPVLAAAVLCLAGLDAAVPQTVVDGTFGAGGHARLLARDLVAGSTYIGVDRDPSAQARFARFADEHPQLLTRFERMPFPDAFMRLRGDRVSADVVILDVGVSSMQLDQTDRGFAYSRDAPLDMRMDSSSGMTAADLLASASASELERILREYGEERFARRIAALIVERRATRPFTRTEELVDAINVAIPAKVRHAPGGHPARRTFQALRIAVNDELGMLDRGLDAALDLLAPGGVLEAIAFHSLEDRIVKRRFEAWATDCVCPPGLPICVCDAVAEVTVLTRRPVIADAAEIADNSRSASAKLRAARKIDVEVAA